MKHTAAHIALVKILAATAVEEYFSEMEKEKGRALSCDGDRDSAKPKGLRNVNRTPVPRRNKA